MADRLQSRECLTLTGAMNTHERFKEIAVGETLGVVTLAAHRRATALKAYSDHDASQNFSVVEQILKLAEANAAGQLAQRSKQLKF